MPGLGLSFNDLSTVLNSIVKQATGQSAQAVVDTSSFISVAQTALLTGYDTLATSISQVLSRTIFSVRPYERKFGGLEVSNAEYGNHIRKLSAVDKDWEKDQRFELTDGESIDQYVVNKPKVLQTNFYGANTYAKSMTVYRDQLDQAFSGPDQFQSFLAMMMQNASDMIEQAHENTARSAVANLIGGIIDLKNAKQVRHLVTEYNAYLGESAALTLEELRAANVYPTFIRWVMAQVKSQSSLLTERSELYHQNFTGYNIPRHTPVSDQKLYMFNDDRYSIETEVMSTTFNNEFLDIIDYETVNFWQSLQSRDGLNITPGYTDATGAVTKGTAVTQGNIFAILFDRETAGYTVVNEWSQPTPFNAAGGYYNQFWHFTDRYWNDFTENAVLFLMD